MSIFHNVARVVVKHAPTILTGLVRSVSLALPSWQAEPP